MLLKVWKIKYKGKINLREKIRLNQLFLQVKFLT